MHRKFYSMAVFLLCLFFASSTRAFDLSSLLTNKGIIKLNADKILYNDKTGVIDAAGNVKIKRADSSLSAQHIIYNSKTYQTKAEGNVQWQIGKDYIKADSIDVNLSTQLGIIKNGYITIENGEYTIKGKVIKKVAVKRLIIEDGSLTTCKCSNNKPSWSISAKYIDATIGGYATIKDAFFKADNIPIIYTPYMTIPVKTARASGFLMPTISYSGLNGLILSIPYFWAISQNKDATFSFDAMTNRGLGASAQFRYALTTKDSGVFDARYFKELFLPYQRDRFYVSGSYYQDLLFGIFSKGLLNYYSDRTYLNDFSSLLQQSSVEYEESKFTLQRNFADADVMASLIYLENMWAANNDATLQQLPFGSITYFPVHIASKLPLYAEFNTNVENFIRSDPALPKGERLGIVPGIYMPFTIGDYLYFNSEALLNAYFYNAGIYGIYHPGKIINTDLSAELSTKLSNVYDIKLGRLKGVKHIIAPFVSINAKHTLTDDEQFAFDQIENSPNESRILNFGILNSFIGKTMPFENMVSYPVIGRFDISSGYDFIEAVRPLTGPTDKRKPFLPVNFDLVIQPPDFLNTNISMLVDPTTLSMTETSIYESANDKRGDSASLNYSYFRSSTSAISAYLNFVLTHYLTFYGGANYSFYQRSLIQAVYGIKLSTPCNCWSLDASYIQRPLTPSLSTISVFFTLKGLGTIGG